MVNWLESLIHTGKFNILWKIIQTYRSVYIYHGLFKALCKVLRYSGKVSRHTVFFLSLKVSKVPGNFPDTLERDLLHRETMDYLRLSTALHSCQNILSEKEQLTFLWRQEVLLSLKDKLPRVVANYLVIEVQGKAGQLASLARSRLLAA